jgi:tetratricopeptide (TPR) repeat protein
MHNVVLNAAVSTGVVGAVALMAVVAVSGITGWRAAEQDARGAATMTASLGGFFVAVLFHYPTIDSGTLAAVVFGALLAASMPRTPEYRAHSKPVAKEGLAWRLGAWSVVGICGTLLIATGANLAADAFASRGLALAGAGAPWQQSRSAFGAARRLSPWEVAYYRATAQGAGLYVRARRDAVALEDGLASIEAARKFAPRDAGLLGSRADLLMISGMSLRRAGLLRAAEASYVDALKIDPNNALYYSGIANIRSALGDNRGAVVAAERAVDLARRSPQMWRELASAYRAAGMPAEARSAEASAATSRRR